MHRPSDTLQIAISFWTCKHFCGPRLVLIRRISRGTSQNTTRTASSCGAQCSRTSVKPGHQSITPVSFDSPQGGIPSLISLAFSSQLQLQSYTSRSMDKLRDHFGEFSSFFVLALNSLGLSRGSCFLPNSFPIMFCPPHIPTLLFLALASASLYSCS